MQYFRTSRRRRARQIRTTVYVLACIALILAIAILLPYLT